MANVQRWKEWLENNKDACIDMLRVYLGVMLFLKGLHFALNEEDALRLLKPVDLPFMPVLLLHLATIAHLAGGPFLMAGLLTRTAALIQIPVLFGAIFFVELGEGLFSRQQSLEYTLTILFLLGVFAIYGGGRLSVDYYLNRRPRKIDQTQP